MDSKEKYFIYNTIIKFYFERYNKAITNKRFKKNKLRLIEKKFNINDIKEADEAFITSATQYVMPVVSVDNFKIGNGKVGKYANIFSKAYMEAIKLS